MQPRQRKYNMSGNDDNYERIKVNSMNNMNNIKRLIEVLVILEKDILHYKTLLIQYIEFIIMGVDLEKEYV